MTSPPNRMSQQSKMNSLIVDNTMEYDLRMDFEERNKEIRIAQIQWANDFLFDFIRDNINNNIDIIKANLQYKIRMGYATTELSTVLFNYNTVRFAKGSKLDSYDHDEIDNYGYEHQVASSLCKVKIDEIVRTTDLLTGLSLLFGPKFRVSVRNSMGPETGRNKYVCCEKQIVLEYWPYGVSIADTDEVFSKYEDYYSRDRYPEDCSIFTGNLAPCSECRIDMAMDTFTPLCAICYWNEEDRIKKARRSSTGTLIA